MDLASDNSTSNLCWSLTMLTGFPVGWAVDDVVPTVGSSFAFCEVYLGGGTTVSCNEPGNRSKSSGGPGGARNISFWSLIGVWVVAGLSAVPWGSVLDPSDIWVDEKDVRKPGTEAPSRLSGKKWKYQRVNRIEAARMKVVNLLRGIGAMVIL